MEASALRRLTNLSCVADESKRGPKCELTRCKILIVIVIIITSVNAITSSIIRARREDNTHRFGEVLLWPELPDHAAGSLGCCLSLGGLLCDYNGSPILLMHAHPLSPSCETS